MEESPSTAVDAILAELSTAVSDLARSVDIAIKQMVLRAELTAAIADTAKATQAAGALLAAAYPTELAKSADIAVRQTVLRSELTATIEDTAKATQAAEALLAAAYPTDLPKSADIAVRQTVLRSELPATVEDMAKATQAVETVIVAAHSTSPSRGQLDEAPSGPNFRELTEEEQQEYLNSFSDEAKKILARIMDKETASESVVTSIPARRELRPALRLLNPPPTRVA